MYNIKEISGMDEQVSEQINAKIYAGGAENARQENAAPNSRGGKCKTGERGNGLLWNSDTA